LIFYTASGTILSTVLDGTIMFTRLLAPGCTTLVLAMFVMGIVAFQQVAPGAAVAIHFDMHGVPNGWASPTVAFFLIPGLCTALLMLQFLLTARLPTLKESTPAATARGLIFLATYLAMLGAQMVIILKAVGVAVPFDLILPLLLSIPLVIRVGIWWKSR
jgi:hypothetical protein